MVFSPIFSLLIILKLSFVKGIKRRIDQKVQVKTIDLWNYEINL